ncbi:ABC transporter substrate-binding protein [Luteimicrobium subarcticum]|uniref:NitT/TauT family transport system substrate-binding protein n=1 Tax=Luteimicrobium subarcticum TaxID=620910 RepID=A0A2M8WV72_9MICO|nr:ABC transporter substrate-binding protein [Luteimicrobium subarcticum]PJI94824.1 NitT/TauT family transport system substrate-binding protein [Luteimicrobium subarcticum]
MTVRHPHPPSSSSATARAPRRRRRLSAALALPLAAVLAASLGACSSDDASGKASDQGPASALRLGYFANVTHAPAVVGVAEGTFQKDLGSTKLSTQIFNAGPAAIEALNAGAIDAAFVGPNPAINAYVKSHGDAIRIVAGAVYGGAQLVVQPDITSAADLKGKDLATPQLGGTQDVALRSWLTDQGLKNSVSGGGDVTITPTDNAQTLQLFQDKKIDGAWVPEPWASRLVLDGGGKVLVDEKTLWPEGKFLTTNLIVSKKFLDEHPETVKGLVQGEVDAVKWIQDNPDEAPKVVNEQIEKLSGKSLSDDVITRAWANITTSVDPLASTLQEVQDHGVTAGTTQKADLKGIYDLRILNSILTADGQPTVSAGGLGEE